MNILIGLSILIVIVICIYAYNDTNSQMITDQEQFHRKWEEELTKPRYKIVFVVNGDQLETEPIKPYKFGNGTGGLSFIQSSLYISEKIIARNYEKGYFTDNSDKTYPTCNIESAWIEECKSE